MRQRLDERGVHREHWIEEMREPDAMRLGDGAVRIAFAVEAPGPPLFSDVQTGLVGPVQDLVVHTAGGVLECQFQRVVAVPLDADHGDQGLGEDAPDRDVGLEVFEPHRGGQILQGGV